MKTDRVVPVRGNIVYYRTDGTGRDSYIHTMNGGLLSHDRIHQLKQFSPQKEKPLSFSKTTYAKHPHSYNKKSQNKFVHYISDGTGRDFYIGANEGGNSTSFNWRNQTQFRFKNSLRGEDKFLEKNPQDKDIFGKSQSKFTMTQSKFDRSLSMIQTARNRELSSPKKHPNPPPLNLYFEKGFDASREFRKHLYGKNH